MSELVYVVPPYLLRTCYGLDIQREVANLDANLAAKNVFSPLKQIYFRQPKDIEIARHVFCNDPAVNAMIREKLKDKFAVLGMLGLSPAGEITDEYLYELYEIFKERLSLADVRGLLKLGLPSTPREPSLLRSTNDPSEAPKAKDSVFWHPKLGEVTFGPFYSKDNESSLANYSLEALINWAKETSEHKYSFFPALVVGSQSFISPLPMYWTPLSVDRHLEHLDRNLGMEIDTASGYSLLKLKLQRDRLATDDLYRKKRYFNFIANNEVQENLGIFYYEVQVDQITTAASEFKPLISLNDSLLALGSSLFFTLGFTKRMVRFDKMPTNTTTGINIQSLDLKQVQSNISFYNQNASNRKLDEDTLTFLGAEPGVSFEGSFAVNFNNSCSYASIKSGDTSYRTSSLNTNRRFSQFNRQTAVDQDTSRIDVEVPFNIHFTSPDRTKKRYRTDTVGCGVNFIDKTLFITLNGILVKTVTEAEMVDSNRHKDSIFEMNQTVGSLFPMIGFQLTELPKEVGEGELPETIVRTNFGLKEFEFNINRYVENCKKQQADELSRKLAVEAQSPPDLTYPEDKSFEKEVADIKGDSEVLNKFIQGYLIQHGYLETLKCFNSDVQELVSHIHNVNGQAKEASSQQEDLVRESHAPERHKVRKMIYERNYLEAANFLQTNYPNIEDLDKCLFDLRFQHYVSLVDRYLKLKFGNDFEFGYSEELKEQNFDLVVKYAEELVKLVSDDTPAQTRIAQFSGVVLASDKETLNEMPAAKRELDEQDQNTEKLANLVNAAILELRNFEKTSKLELLIQSTGGNISSLCMENDNSFKLVNYEQDYIEL